MTVQELIEELKKFPPKLRVVGYNGSGHDRPVSVYLRDEEARREDDPLIQVVVIDTD